MKKKIGRRGVCVLIIVIIIRASCLRRHDRASFGLVVVVPFLFYDYATPPPLPPLHREKLNWKKEKKKEY